MKAELCTKIPSNEEVQSKWEVFARDMDDDVGRKLLDVITELWGVLMLVHVYKTESKKTLQRSKGLRKVILLKVNICS